MRAFICFISNVHKKDLWPLFHGVIQTDEILLLNGKVWDWNLCFKGQHSSDFRPISESAAESAAHMSTVQLQFAVIPLCWRISKLKPDLLLRGLGKVVVQPKMNCLHILVLWEEVYGTGERERETEERTSSNPSSVLWHPFAPVHNRFIFMCLLMHAFLYMCVRVGRGHVWHVYVCFDCMRQYKKHTSTGHIFQVCLTHLKC